MSKQYRVCSSDNCKVRLPDLTHDGHSRCSSCIGHLCSRDNHCLECAGWGNDVFDRYLKHRHTLELTRARKAKQRSKAKQSSVDSLISQQPLAASAHSISPSTSSVVNLSVASPVSAYSPSANPSTSSTPPAVVSSPSDQVVTRSEFDSLKNLMI